MALNRLFYGDNLDVLRQSIPANSVDLVYLDPPFNSNRSYNVILTGMTSLRTQTVLRFRRSTTLGSGHPSRTSSTRGTSRGNFPTRSPTRLGPAII